MTLGATVTNDISAHQTALDSDVSVPGPKAPGVGSAVLSHAPPGLGLRIAVVGKGGSGKTVIAGTLARILAHRARRVLAVDLDSNPGLSYTLGLGLSEAGLPDEALEERPGAAYGWNLAEGLEPSDVVERFTAPGPDGLRYLGIGKLSGADKGHTKRSVSAIRTVVGGFHDPGWDVIADLEGGLSTPFERYHSFADAVIVVVGPSWVSSMTARRLLALVAEVPTMVVANRVPAGARIEGLTPVVTVPADRRVVEAERCGASPFDFCPDSPAVAAISGLADVLTQEVPL